ncbi:hypothetical protein CCACVL1_07580 [Corchorus capsularis]|uniref:Uncharacterized protein n=1 Tax=Corchorus capsularis TaxID=210143 RepID=A0A1R3J4X2_COCAP|nr:hypothetical protein CCACVL1_07580 [Corchorus capsularis]
MAKGLQQMEKRVAPPGVGALRFGLGFISRVLGLHQKGQKEKGDFEGFKSVTIYGGNSGGEAIDA